MERLSIKEKIESFPQTPGVYLMKGEGGKIVYVGKAKNLKSRVKSYFNKEADGRYQVQFLMRRVVDIDYLITNNEKEALLLENSLIKKHKPRYNIFLKDDKTYVSLKLSTNHSFPQLTVTRKVKKDGALYFGPYSSAEACHETVEFIYRNFRLRTCSDHELNNRSRPCLEYQIGRCTAPCVGYVNREEYARQVDKVRFFLDGKNRELIDQVRHQMEEAALNEKFEEAAHYRDLLQNIESTLEKQSVVKHGGKHQDLIYLYREGQKGIVAVLNIREGVLIDSRYYSLDSVEEDIVLMENFLNQFYAINPFVPDEILISTLLPESNALIDLLEERKGKKVTLRNPQKGEKKDLLEIAEKNAKSHFARLVRKQYEAQEILKILKERLGLLHFPKRMECYDISNISGKMATGSRVVFIDGVPDKKHYRTYKIRLKSEPDDYAMMREMLERRFQKATGDIPDLVVIDGGKGQLSVALKVLEELSLIDIPVIGFAKGKGEGVRAKGLWNEKKEEEIYLPHRKNPLILKRGSPELMMLQRLRDEAHRFAIKYHRKLRDEIAV